MITTKTSSKWLGDVSSIYIKGASNYPIFNKSSPVPEPTFQEYIQSLFADGSQGLYYDIQNPTTTEDLGYILDSSKAMFGSDIKNTGVTGLAGMATYAYYDRDTGVGEVYRSDMYNQSLVNFFIDQSKTYEMIIENIGDNPISVKVEAGSGTTLFSVPVGQKVTKIVEGYSTLVITSTNDLTTSDFKVYSLRQVLGNTAKQPNAAKKATVVDRNGYKALKFDGYDDFYQTPSIDFTSADKITVIVAVRKLSDATRAVLLESSASFAINNGSFILQAPYANGVAGYYCGIQNNRTLVSISANRPSPNSSVFTYKLDISKTVKEQQIISSDANATYSGEAVDVGKFGNYPLFLGMRNGTSLPFNGEIYALLIIAKTLTAEQTTKIEKEFGKYLGLSL